MVDHICKHQSANNGPNGLTFCGLLEGVNDVNLLVKRITKIHFGFHIMQDIGEVGTFKEKVVERIRKKVA